MSLRGAPEPGDIRAARESVGHSQADAAALVHAVKRTWQMWEAGDRKMPAASWELYRIKTGQGFDAPEVRAIIAVRSTVSKEGCIEVVSLSDPEVTGIDAKDVSLTMVRLQTDTVKEETRQRLIELGWTPPSQGGEL